MGLLTKNYIETKLKLILNPNARFKRTNGLI